MLITKMIVFTIRIVNSDSVEIFERKYLSTNGRLSARKNALGINSPAVEIPDFAGAGGGGGVPSVPNKTLITFSS